MAFNLDDFSCIPIHIDVVPTSMFKELKSVFNRLLLHLIPIHSPYALIYIANVYRLRYIRKEKTLYFHDYPIFNFWDAVHLPPPLRNSPTFHSS